MTTTKGKRTSIEQMIVDARAFGAPVGELNQWIHNNPEYAKRLAKRFDSHQYNDKSIVYTQLSTELELINLVETLLQLKVLLIFIQCSNQSGELQISNRDLQRMVGNHDKKQIAKVLDFLIKHGIIAVKEKGKCRKPTIYMLNPQISHCGKVNQWNDENAFWDLVDNDEIYSEWLKLTIHRTYIVNSASAGNYKSDNYHRFNIIEFVDDIEKASNVATTSDASDNIGNSHNQEDKSPDETCSEDVLPEDIPEDEELPFYN